MYYYRLYQSPIGNIFLCSTETYIVGLWIEGQKYFKGTVDEEMIENDELKVLCDAKVWLDEYFAGKKPDLNRLPLAPIGNEFRQCVWQLLKEIPYGETRTYSDLAKDVARHMGKKSMSAQAVGGAVGHNPISIIIPCHRVVGGNGSLTGYAGGIHKKIWLLEHEGLDMTKFYVPKKGTAL